MCFQGSGISTIMASGRSIPFMVRNSRVLSSMAESDPSPAMTGQILSMSASSTEECIVSSLASMRSMLPRIVLISPLCASIR